MFTSRKEIPLKEQGVGAIGANFKQDFLMGGCITILSVYLVLAPQFVSP